MGRKSNKPNKNIYFQLRENLNWSREHASDMMDDFISEHRLEKIETGKSPITPSEVIEMSKIYQDAYLCNYYCTHECPIGQEIDATGHKYVPVITLKDLSDITLYMLSTLNSLDAIE